LDLAPGGTPYHLAVMRLNANGQIDPAFGSSGKFRLPDGSGSEGISLAMRAGRIVVTGRSNGYKDGIVVRLNLDGSLDSDFATGGIATFKSKGRISAPSISASGMISALISPTKVSPQVSVLRLTGAGKPDPTFSADGISDPQNVFGDGMFPGPKGSIVVVGHTPVGAEVLLVQISSQGKTGGTQAIRGDGVLRASPVLAPDGIEYLVGSIAPSLGSDAKQVFIARIGADGLLDSTYGKAGIRIVSTKNQNFPFAATFGAGNSLFVSAAGFAKSNFRDLTSEVLRLTV
jgi:uncharacterized delta-60 repeat protein